MPFFASFLDMDADRYATQRGRYLARTTDLRQPEAEAVAYSERGYSFDGIAKKLDVSESTAQEYMERAMALYGLEIAETMLPTENPPDYEMVDVDYLDKLSDRTELETWVKYVDRHADKLPADWTNKIIEQAESEKLREI